MLDVRPRLRVTMCFPSENRILAALSLLPSANTSGRKGGEVVPFQQAAA